MPLVHALPVATTSPGSPRASTTVNYNGVDTENLQVTIVCPTWDTEDPSNQISVAVQQSFDGGVSWSDFARLDLQPQQRNMHGQIPAMSCQVVDDLGARRARILLTVTASIAIGVDVTTV